jgi:hypothetical protein
LPGVAGRITSRTAAVALPLIAASVALAACGGSGSSGGDGSSASPAPPKVGTSVRIPAGGTTLVVNVQRVTFPLRGSGMLLSPGDAAAGVEVSARNAGHAIYDSSSESDVSLRTSLGSAAEPGFAAHGPCATSEIDFLKEVQPGESRSGCVAFDVPRGTKPAAVRFSPNGRGGLGRTWVIEG